MTVPWPFFHLAALLKEALISSRRAAGHWLTGSLPHEWEAWQDDHKIGREADKWMESILPRSDAWGHFDPPTQLRIEAEVTVYIRDVVAHHKWSPGHLERTPHPVPALKFLNWVHGGERGPRPGMTAAVKEEVEKLAERHGISLSRVPGYQDPPLPNYSEHSLARSSRRTHTSADTAAAATGIPAAYHPMGRWEA
ncbi:hypothetical protein JCM6882_003351 [Rhodosporidiobolus microsporus]